MMTLVNDIRDVVLVIFCCLSMVLLGSSCVTATTYVQ